MPKRLLLLSGVEVVEFLGDEFMRGIYAIENKSLLGEVCSLRT